MPTRAATSKADCSKPQGSATQAPVMEAVQRHADAGKPVIGLRTATHAFQGGEKIGDSLTYDQFGRQILGEQWVSHHGHHKRPGGAGRS